LHGSNKTFYGDSFATANKNHSALTSSAELSAEPKLPGLEGGLSAAGKRFAIVVSRFNAFITERLLQSAHDGLLRSGAVKKNIQIVRVPGAFEIPSAARALAETGKYDAIICVGCLLRGDTAHYDVIVNEVARGIGQSAQETGVPHAFGVLTCENLEQAIDRAGLKMGNKGFEAAQAAIEMASLTQAISRQRSALRNTKTKIPSASKPGSSKSGSSKPGSSKPGSSKSGSPRRRRKA
jgi:6,7-dimethyl-8-ribityllumazine synthase